MNDLRFDHLDFETMCWLVPVVVFFLSAFLFALSAKNRLRKSPKPSFSVYADSTWGEGMRIGVKTTKASFPSFAEAHRSKGHLTSLIALNSPTFKTHYLRTTIIEDVMDTVAIAEAIEAAKDLAQRCNDYTDERDRQMAMIAERVREANGR